MNPTRVSVLGYGRFGRALCELLADHGLAVRAFDPHRAVPDAIASPSTEALLSASDIVVVAVPVSAFDGALRALTPHLCARHVVIDVGSVKVGPEHAMREILGTEIAWVATHPLFGPASLARGEHPLAVVVCPNAIHPRAVETARALYERLGCEVVAQDADAHDRAMAETHALAFFVAKGLLDIGAGQNAPFSPPSFRAMARTIEAVRADAGHLFSAIERENPYARVSRKRLLDALQTIDEQLLQVGEADAATPDAFEIPDYGARSPDLVETRELIDEVDREIVGLLARRAELSIRAGRAKAREGLGVVDPDRERNLTESRAKWAKDAGLSTSLVCDVFDVILLHSRGLQR